MRQTLGISQVLNMPALFHI